MAMIKCSECGAEISDKAKTCIHCGCPVSVEVVQGKLMLKVSKHPRDKQPLARVGILPNVSLYLIKPNGELFGTMKSGAWATFKIDKETSFYISYTKKLGKGINDMGRSDLITVKPNKVTRLQVDFVQIRGVIKISVNEVDIIDSD